MITSYDTVNTLIRTEKGTVLEAEGKYLFDVAKRANKIEIKQAVQTLLKTKVLDVRTMNVRGKRRRMGKNVGRRSHWKKAVVKLAPGENIEFFEGT